MASPNTGSNKLRSIRDLLPRIWTDYQVFGANNAAPAMRAALKGLNDHRLITWAKYSRRGLPTMA